MIGHAERFNKVNAREDKIWVDQIKKERRIQKEWVDTFGDVVSMPKLKVKVDEKKGVVLSRKFNSTSTYKSNYLGKKPLDICSKKHARVECRYKTIIMF